MTHESVSSRCDSIVKTKISPAKIQADLLQLQKSSSVITNSPEPHSLQTFNITVNGNSDNSNSSVNGNSDLSLKSQSIDDKEMNTDGHCQVLKPNSSKCLQQLPVNASASTPGTDSTANKCDDKSLDHLSAVHRDLQIQIKEQEEKLRKLRMVKMYREKVC